ncbi:hypothetical protein [Alkalicoccus halolimnae]|uniref:Uncharacterized protein n=1 Tax=Alkalicoccus halolimnae TaxID=1667239 RepID=A0AAJ8N3R4_9BACI|nr:hypothetical protein [Alkalicoccus halolimnae]
MTKRNGLIILLSFPLLLTACGDQNELNTVNPEENINDSDVPEENESSEE